MAAVERNRNTRPTGFARHRLGRTPYERVATRQGQSGADTGLDTNSLGATQSDEEPAARAASRLSTISRSVVRAFGSLWHSSDSTDSPDTKQPAAPALSAKPLVLRTAMPGAVDALSTAATAGSSDPGSQMSSVSPEPSIEEPVNRSLVWSESTAQPQFDLSMLQVDGSLNLPANMIISAYREALLANETSTLKRRRRSSPPTPEPPVTPRNKVPSKPEGDAHDLAPDAPPPLPALAQTTHLSKVQEPPQKAAKLEVDGDITKVPVAAPALASQTRIELVTRPVIDLTQLPEDRKKRPGFISVNFELSDSEDEESPVEAAPARRPLIENAEIIEARKANKEVTFKAAEKPTFSFDDKPNLDKPADANKPAFSFGSVPETSGKLESSEEKPKQVFSFGSKPDAESAKPASSLDSKPSSEPAKPAFSFGKGSEDKDLKPAFTLSSGPETQAKPAFSFGEPVKKSEELVEPAKPKDPIPGSNPSGGAPVFSFGQSEKPDKAIEQSATPFSFGSAAEKRSAPDEAPAKPAFSFGANNSATAEKPADKPTFSFGNSEKPAEKPAGTPAFSFGQTNNSADKPADKPAFSFGQSNDNTTKPALSFGQTANQDKPAEKAAFSFGQSDKPADKPADKPVFSFGQSDKPAEKPAFSFGQDKPSEVATNANAASGSTGFTFGATKASTPEGSAERATTPFTFGASKPAEPAEPAKPFSFTSQASTTPGPFDKPAESSTGFTFGASATTSTPFNKPATQSGFSFGANQPAQGQPPAQPFTFGAQKDTNGGGFTFGANGTGAATTGTPTPGAPTPGAPTPGASGTGGFTFGQSQPQQSQGAQFGANSNFSFASNGAKPAGSGFSFGSNGSTPFGGQTAQPQPGQLSQPANPGGFGFGANSSGFGSNGSVAGMGGAPAAFANNPLAAGLTQAPATRPDGRPLAQVRRRIPRR